MGKDVFNLKKKYQMKLITDKPIKSQNTFFAQENWNQKNAAKRR